MARRRIMRDRRGMGMTFFVYFCLFFSSSLSVWCPTTVDNVLDVVLGEDNTSSTLFEQLREHTYTHRHTIDLREVKARRRGALLSVF